MLGPRHAYKNGGCGGYFCSDVLSGSGGGRGLGLMQFCPLDIPQTVPHKSRSRLKKGMKLTLIERLSMDEVILYTLFFYKDQ